MTTIYDKFEERVKVLANEMFERWKKEAKDWVREEQRAVIEEEREREEEQRKLPEIPKEEIIHLHKEIEKEQKKKKPSPKTEKKETSSFDPDFYLLTSDQE